MPLPVALSAFRSAPRLARLLVLAVPLLAAACSVPTRRGAVWEGGADGFPTAELHVPRDEVACLEAEMWPDDLRLGAVEGGADGFTESGYAPEQPHCLAGAAGGWRAAGGWGVLGGWTPFPGPQAQEGGGRPSEFSGLWDGDPVRVSGGPGLFPIHAFWPTGSPSIRPSAGEGDSPPGEGGPDDDETLLVDDPARDPASVFPSAIAEPATLVLLGSALMVLGLLRRERDSGVALR